MIQISSYQSSDFEQLLSLNLTEQEEWWHVSANLTKTEKATWEQLTPFERFAHGGWWSDPQTLKLHLKIMKQAQGKIYLARKKDKVIGEIELVFGSEIREKIPILRGHIIWLYVHPNHRRKGIAKALIQHAKKEAAKLQAKCLLVEPEDEKSERMYATQGRIHEYKLTPELFQPQGHQFHYQEITIEELQKQSHLHQRIVGTYYLPHYDLIRIQYYPQLNKILGTHYFKEYIFLKIQLTSTLHAYAILSPQPRLWIPLALRKNKEKLRNLITFIFEESFIYGFHDLSIQIPQSWVHDLDLQLILPQPREIIPSFKIGV